MARENVTEELGALVDSETGERVTFDLNPDSFEDDKSTDLAEIKIPGMSHPRLQFTNGATRTVKFNLFLHYGATDDVVDALETLQSWLYPEYENGRLSKAPAKLMLIFGETGPDEIWIMKTCNVTRARFDKELECVLAKVSIELVEYIEESRDSRDFRRESGVG
ncbi:MAG: hypothetical protein II917_03975 [Synergistaceae bacterium]|nr:hypothetical protein [Synergistaceae bacterium]